MIESHPLQIRSGERCISARLFVPNNPTGRGILFIHGYGSNQGSYLARATTVSETLGAVCLTFDLSGHGLSGSDPKIFSALDHLEDALRSFDYLFLSTMIDQRRIGVCGASYGGGLGAIVAGERPDTQRLVLRAPSLIRESEMGAGSESGRPIDSLESLRVFPGKTLIVASEFDEVIPQQTLDLYLSVCRFGSVKTIRGATHTLAREAWQADFLRIMLGWFGDL